MSNKMYLIVKQKEKKSSQLLKKSSSQFNGSLYADILFFMRRENHLPSFH